MVPHWALWDNQYVITTSFSQLTINIDSPFIILTQISLHVSLYSIKKKNMPGLISVALLCVNLILAMHFLSFYVNIAEWHFKWFQAKPNIASPDLSISVKNKLIIFGVGWGRPQKSYITLLMWQLFLIN